MSLTVKNTVVGGILCALALALSLVDRFIPLAAFVPLPGIKLGLANIVTVFALYSLGTYPAFSILITRCILGAFMAGSVTTLVFSLLGGILSLAAMSLLKNTRYLSLLGISIAGAALHNIGQVCAAYFILGSSAVLAYLPVLLIVSIFTGAAIAAASAAIFKATNSMSKLIT